MPIITRLRLVKLAYELERELGMSSWLVDIWPDVDIHHPGSVRTIRSTLRSD